MIISPWGEIKAQLGQDNQGPEIAVAEIDIEQVEKVRKEMPLLRRTLVSKLLNPFSVTQLISSQRRVSRNLTDQESDGLET